jgi:DNA repair protein RadD
MLELRYHQRQATDAFFDYVPRNPGKNPLIVLPTGTGKSLVQADIVRTVIGQGARVLCITHQKELIWQNYEEFNNLLLLPDAGIYSAGLKRSDTENQVIFAGIQSVHKKAYYLGRFDLIIVDEAHSIPNKAEGTYRKFLADCHRINPSLVVLGLTATPYRLKGGMLTDGESPIFHKIIHETSIAEMVDADHYLNLDKKQYLAKPVTKRTKNNANMDGVRKSMGDYVESEMQERFTEGDLVERSVNEIIEATHDRNKILIFTAGIDHAHKVFELLPFGSAGIVTSKQTNAQNERALEDFSSGQIKYLVNVNVLTTGYNERAIDCVVLLRKTLSPGLYVQMVGRGTRMWPGKENFLVMDFGNNIEMHGPIDKIEVRNPVKNSNKENGSPVKYCPNCESTLHVSVRICPDCGHEFPEPERHEPTASEQSILSERKKPEEYDVQFVMYFRHRKEGKPDSVKVSYNCGDYLTFNEWIMLDHGCYPTQKANGYLQLVCPPGMIPFVNSTDEMLEVAEKFFKKPVRIKVDENEKFPRVIEYALPDEFPATEEEIQNYISFKNELAEIPF